MLRSLVLLPLMLATVVGCASDPAPTPTPVPPTAPVSEPGPATAASVDSEPASELEADAHAALAELLARMDVELSLSPDTRTEVHAVLTEQVDRMTPLMEEIAAEPSRAAKVRRARAHKTELETIREHTEARMRDLLDEAQYQRYEELRLELRDELRDSMRARYG